MSEAGIQAVRAANKHWLDTFAFQDLENASVTSHVIPNLEPGIRYAFIVASTRTRFGVVRDTDWSDWVIEPIAPAVACPGSNTGGGPSQPGFGGVTPTPVPTPTPALGHDGTCPITGLPIGDGYKSVRQTVTGVFGSYTLQTVEFPDFVQWGEDRVVPNDGRVFVRTCGTYRNFLSYPWGFYSGSGLLLDTDAGLGFDISWADDAANGGGQVPAGESEYICLTWNTPASATVIVVAVATGSSQQNIHLYRHDRP